MLPLAITLKPAWTKEQEENWKRIAAEEGMQMACVREPDVWSVFKKEEISDEESERVS